MYIPYVRTEFSIKLPPNYVSDTYTVFPHNMKHQILFQFDKPFLIYCRLSIFWGTFGFYPKKVGLKYHKHLLHLTATLHREKKIYSEKLHSKIDKNMEHRKLCGTLMWYIHLYVQEWQTIPLVSRYWIVICCFIQSYRSVSQQIFFVWLHDVSI